MTAAEKLLESKTEFQIWVPLTPLQFEIYNRIVRRDSQNQSGSNLANKEGSRQDLRMFHHLCALCCHPQAWKNGFYWRKYSGIRELDEFSDQYQRDANLPDNDDMCLEPIYAGKSDLLSPAYSNKMLVLLSIKHSKDVNDHVLVFSNYITTLDYIQYVLYRRTNFSFLRIDGSTKEQTRRHDIAHFNK